MRYRGVIIILVIILFSFPIIFSNDTEISEVVLENIEETEVKVIVELEQPLEDLSRIEKLQSADVDLQPLTENLYRATIDKQDLNELLLDPNVQSINKDEVFHILLADSVPLINASAVHTLQNNSINLTGRAQTICIIDSGVNSTHLGLKGRVIAQKCFCSITDNGAGGCCSDNTIESNTSADDHGHGTHVAGIAASNGSSIIGVAPEANIIAIKVTNSAGTGLFSDILLGLQWCNDNSSLYNVTVISISMGGGSYTAACDDSYTSLSAEIEEAWNKNVTVTVATGNSGSTTIMTSPACINKTISVSATTKADAIWSSSNRNSLTDLFSPGSLIVSTALAGSTETRSGTSMATPHVAGVIALLQQYKQEIEGRPLTAQEINTTLASNGTLIDDTTGSGRTFIRIDAYKALAAIDNLFPQLTYTNTTSSTNYIYNNLTFLANTTDVNLKSVLLESNHTGSLVNYSITNVNNNQYNYTLTNSSFSSGTFQWRILVNDSHGNINASVWHNLTIYTGSPIITLSYPTNNLITNNASTIINFTVIDDTDSTFNCTLYSDSALNQTKNISNGSLSAFKVNYTQGIHNWNILCNDSQLLTSNSTLNTITIDQTQPYFLSETLTSTLELGNNQTYTVIANDTYLRYVNFSYDGTNYSLTNTSTTFSKIFTTYQNGTNSFTTYTADYANNVNASTNSFTVQDTISGPRIVNLRYSTSVTYNTNQYITLFIVDSRTISSTLLSYNGINYTLSNNTNYNYTYTFAASICGTNTFKIFTNDTQNNGITNTTTFSVTGCCGDGTCSSETCTSCPTDCNTCSTSSSSGGGGGGGTTTPVTKTTEANETIETEEIITYAPETTILEITPTIIEEASPENPIDLNIEDTITNLFISVNEKVSDIEINVESLEMLPTSIPIPQEKVFKYFKINITNLSYSSIDNATITFKVTKSWITENYFSPESIKLQRYDSTWEPLKTTLNSEDADSYEYTSTTPGFSYFAITGNQIQESQTNWVLISITTILILIALILFLVHELKHNEE